MPLAPFRRSASHIVFIDTKHISQKTFLPFLIDERSKCTGFWATPSVQFDDVLTAINASLERRRVPHYKLSPTKAISAQIFSAYKNSVSNIIFSCWKFPTVVATNTKASVSRGLRRNLNDRVGSRWLRPVAIPFGPTTMGWSDWIEVKS